MKKTLLSLILISTSALASHLPSVKDVQIFVKKPGEMLPVQPYSFVTFKIASCAKREDLSIEKEKSAYGHEIMFKIVDANPMDCRMRAVEREYRLQLSSDATGEKYILLNPLAPTYL